MCISILLVDSTALASDFLYLMLARCYGFLIACMRLVARHRAFGDILAGFLSKDVERENSEC